MESREEPALGRQGMERLTREPQSEAQEAGAPGGGEEPGKAGAAVPASRTSEPRWARRQGAEHGGQEEHDFTASGVGAFKQENTQFDLHSKKTCLAEQKMDWGGRGNGLLLEGRGADPDKRPWWLGLQMGVSPP